MTAIRSISLGQHRENVNLHKNKHSYVTETGLKTGFGFFQQNDALIFVNVFTFANLACSLKKKKIYTYHARLNSLMSRPCPEGRVPDRTHMLSRY